MQKQKATLFAAIGSAFEYYDFIIYAMLVPIIAHLFFPDGAHEIKIIQSFFLFGLAYLARPFGAFFFGLLGDHYGAQKTLSGLMILMGVITFAMGLLPTYASIGIYAPILLGLLRLLQGITFGAELPGAIHYLSEHHEIDERGHAIGWTIAGTSAGALLATLFLWQLSSHYSAEALSSWAWRIPFFVGGALAFIGYLLRKSISQTNFKPIKKLSKNAPRSLGIICFKHKKCFMKAILIALLPANLIIINLYFPTYLSSHFSFELKTIYYTMSYAMGFTTVLSPFIGRFFTDRLGARHGLMIASLLILMLLPLQINLLERSNLLAFLLIHQLFIMLSIISAFSLLSIIFVKKIRFTALAMSYNIAYFIAAFMPAILTIFIQKTSADSLFVFIGIIAFLSFLVAFKLQMKSE